MYFNCADRKKKNMYFNCMADFNFIRVLEIRVILKYMHIIYFGINYNSLVDIIRRENK